MKHTTLDARPETELNVDQVTFPLKSLPSELRCQIYKEMSALACKAPFSQMLQTERTDEEVSAHALTYGEALLRQVNREFRSEITKLILARRNTVRVLTADSIFDMLERPTLTNPDVSQSRSEESEENGVYGLLTDHPATALASLASNGWSSSELRTLVIPTVARNDDKSRYCAADIMSHFFSFLFDNRALLLPGLSTLVFISVPDRPGHNSTWTCACTLCASGGDRQVSKRIEALSHSYAPEAMNGFLSSDPDLRVIRCADHPLPDTVPLDLGFKISSFDGRGEQKA